MYAKTLVPGPPPVPGLVGTTLEATVLLPQLLSLGWAVFGDPPPHHPAGELIIGADRLRLIVDGHALLDDTNPPSPAGWWPAIDRLDGRCAVIVCADHRLSLTSSTLGRQLTALMGTGHAVYAALPVRTELPD